MNSNLILKQILEESTLGHAVEASLRRLEDRLAAFKYEHELINLRQQVQKAQSGQRDVKESLQSKEMPRILTRQNNISVGASEQALAIPLDEFVLVTDDFCATKTPAFDPNMRIKDFLLLKAVVNPIFLERVQYSSFDPTCVRTNWWETIRICCELSRLDGLVPCYEFLGDDQISFRPHANGYRLPTEAEWHFAEQSRALKGMLVGSDIFEWVWGRYRKNAIPFDHQWRAYATKDVLVVRTLNSGQRNSAKPTEGYTFRLARNWN